MEKWEIRLLKSELIEIKGEIRQTQELFGHHFERLEQQMEAQEERFHKKFEVLEKLLNKVLENQN